jgi:hypothetical protein
MVGRIVGFRGGTATDGFLVGELVGPEKEMRGKIEAGRIQDLPHVDPQQSNAQSPLLMQALLESRLSSRESPRRPSCDLAN